MEPSLDANLVLFNCELLIIGPGEDVVAGAVVCGNEVAKEGGIAGPLEVIEVLAFAEAGANSAEVVVFVAVDVIIGSW